MNISTYCHVDQGIKTYDIDKLPNEEACLLVAKECTSNARMERFKSITKGVMAAGVTIAMICVALAVANVATILTAIALMPLQVVPPLFIFAVILGGAGSGLAFGYFSIKATGKAIFDQAVVNWQKGDHYFVQASAANLRKAAL